MTLQIEYTELLPLDWINTPSAYLELGPIQSANVRV